MAFALLLLQSAAAHGQEIGATEQGREAMMCGQSCLTVEMQLQLVTTAYKPKPVGNRYKVSKGSCHQTILPVLACRVSRHCSNTRWMHAV